MARRFFNPEGFLWKPLGIIGDLVILSLLWCLCSIGLVTLGPATAALYDTVVHTLRRKEGASFTRFFETFRRELKEGVLLTLLWAAAALVLGLAVWALLRLFPALAERGAVVSLIGLLLIFLYFAAASWLFPTLSRFSMGVRAICAACLRLAAGYALRSAAIALITLSVIAASARFAAPIMIAPALAAYLCSFLIEPVFRRFEEDAAAGSREEE